MRERIEQFIDAELEPDLDERTDISAQRKSWYKA